MSCPPFRRVRCTADPSPLLKKVTPFTEKLFTLFLSALADPEAEVQSNAAFAIGSLIWNTQTDLSSQYMTVLGALHPLFNPSGDGTRKENAQDNAAGAVARMILKNQAAVPLEQVLPIFLQALPLKRDWAESEWTFNAIFQLFQAQHPIILQNLDHILAVFGVALASVQTSFYPTDDAQLKETTRDRVVELLKAINASAPEKIAAAGECIRNPCHIRCSAR